MPEGARADAVLQRILEILPAAAREGGVCLQDLSESLGVPAERILQDLHEVTARAYYHPAGSAEDIQILIEGDRVTVWTTGEFRRPVKLLPREALALALGVRVLASDAGEERRSELLEFVERLESVLATASTDRFLPSFSLDPVEGAGDELWALVFQAARGRRACRIVYLSSGASSPMERVVHPYVLAYAEGDWYVVGHCCLRGEVRRFRLDRVLDASLLKEAFQVPQAFEPADYLDRGRVYRADDEVEAVVRYSPHIARWILERGVGEEQPDGSVVAHHRVADPHWAVRHVLQYGRDAELLEPEELRGMVMEAVGRVLRA